MDSKKNPAAKGSIPRLCLGVLLMLAVTMFPAATAGQNAGGISGRVVEMIAGDNVPLPGADVTVSVSGSVYSAESAADGSFVISNIPAGTYSLTASKSGYVSPVYENILVEAGETENMGDVELLLGIGGGFDDLTMWELTAGYAPGTQETKTVTISARGSIGLYNFSTTLSGDDADAFIITPPDPDSLGEPGDSAIFTITARDALAAGTYVATVTMSADYSPPENMAPVTFTVTQVVNPLVGATIAPDTGVFDKNPANQADVTTTITWNDASQVLDIKAGGTSIGASSYDVTGTTLTFKREFLATQPTGNLALDIAFDLGSDVMTITITDTTPPPLVGATIAPDTGVFDKNPASQADVTTTITWNDASQVLDITAGGASIGAGSYDVTGTTLTFKREFLATQPTGNLALDIAFDLGNDVMTITITDTTPPPLVGATIAPDTGVFDKNPANQADVTTTITWNDASQVLDITAGGASIGAGSYDVAGNTLTFKRQFLATQPTGNLVLDIAFDLGSDVMTITITNTTSPLVSATIDPETAVFDLNRPTDVLTRITWNDAKDVADVIYGTPLVAGDDYEVTNDDGSTATLTIKRAYLSGLNMTKGDSIGLAISFDVGDGAVLTVNVVDSHRPGGGGGKRNTAAREQPPDGLLIDRMPGYIYISQPVKIDEIRQEIVLNYNKALLDANPKHAPRVYYWNTPAGKWVALASYSAGDGKVTAVNDGGYSGWFTAFGVIQPAFFDIRPTDRAEQVINRMNGLGIIEGYPGMSGDLNRPVKDAQNISRTEHALLIYRILNIDPDKPLLEAMPRQEAKALLQAGYSDGDEVPDWAVEMVGAVVNKGLLMDRNGELQGDLPISRIEGAVMVSKALRILPDYEYKAADLSGFADSAQVPAWAKGEVAEGIIFGFPDGTLRPNGEFSRAEALDALLRLFIYEQGW